MSTTVVTGPLRWCRCGHGEHEHRDWLIDCNAQGCRCKGYHWDRQRRRRIDDGTVYRWDEQDGRFYKWGEQWGSTTNG